MTEEQLNKAISIKAKITHIEKSISEVQAWEDPNSPYSTLPEDIPAEIFETFRKDSLLAMRQRLTWLEEEFDNI